MTATKRTALITGGSLNIGLAITTRLLTEGFHVIVADIVEPKLDEATLHDYQHRLTYQPVDFADQDSVKKFIAALANRSDITHLVNNVGIVKPAGIEAATEEDFTALMAVNVQSAIACTQALLPHMKAAGYGRIVSIASRVVLGKKDRTHYAASKGAMVSMSKTWALELGQYGITVNCIAPGPIATSAFWRNNPPEAASTQAIINQVPVQRIGQPEDVAHAASFFLKPESSFITGQVLYVCGGVTTGLAN